MPPADEKRRTLQYQSGPDEIGDLRRENWRQTRNAAYLLITLIAVTIGVVLGLATFCGAFLSVAQGRVGTDWPLLSVLFAVASGSIVLSYWAQGRIDSD